MHVRFPFDVIVLEFLILQLTPCLVAKFKIPKKKIQHLHGELNLDEIKNALHSLPVNRETDLMNLIRR